MFWSFLAIFQLLDKKSAACYLYFIEFYYRCNVSVIVLIRKYIIGE